MNEYGTWLGGEPFGAASFDNPDDNFDINLMRSDPGFTAWDVLTLGGKGAAATQLEIKLGDIVKWKERRNDT